MPVDPGAALEAADRLRGYQRELLGALVSRPSVRAEPSDIHEICAEELGGLGMDVEFITPRVEQLESHPEWCPPSPACAEPERMASVLGSSGEGPGILLFAHIDTEKPEPREGLGNRSIPGYRSRGTHPGSGGRRRQGGGGLGAGRRPGLSCPRLEGVRLVMALVHGKLGGGLGTLPAMARVGQVDAAVYSHPAETGKGMSHFKIATRGFFNFRIETAGRRPDPVEIRTPNSEDPRQGVNAFTRLRAVLDQVDRWADREGVLCSINRVSAGIDSVVLPERAVAEGSVWFHRGTTLDVYQNLNRVALDAEALSTRLSGMRSNPAETPADHPLASATSRAIAAETGLTAAVYPAHVASDIRFPIRCLGVPTVGFGALAGNFYGPNEWVDTADLHRATRAIIRIVSAWADQATGENPWPLLDSPPC